MARPGVSAGDVVMVDLTAMIATPATTAHPINYSLSSSHWLARMVVNPASVSL